nr:5'/3'-nucleotidase SurE [Desulfobulbaceae bacterium]
MNKAPLILVTNDDGVYAPGIQALFEAMKGVGTPVMVAPERDNSAVSHSLTMTRPLKVKKIAAEIFTLDGTPADCVILALEKLLDRKPDLVVSGINHGGNLCEDISYSGTVSAAIEGTMLGVPSMAVSMPGEAPFCFETGAAVAQKIAHKILKNGLPKDTLLNINVPNVASVDGLNVVFTRQGKRVYSDVVKETFDPWGRKHYWIGGGTPSWDTNEGTDSKEVLANNISITPIHLDLTNYEALESLRQWDV